MISPNSRQAYAAIAADNTITRMQRYVLAIIAKHPGVTDKMIADIGRLKINQVTPRRGELANAGRIYCCGQIKRYANGRTISENQWRVS